MFTITVNYKDFDEIERKETLHFNLSKTELLDLEVSYPGGLEAYGKRLTESMDRKGLTEFVHDILKRTYGVKDPQGKRFIKNEEIFAEFRESPAYDEIFIKLLTDDDFVYKFLTSCIPKGDGSTPTKDEIKKKFEEMNKSDYEIKKNTVVEFNPSEKVEVKDSEN